MLVCIREGSRSKRVIACGSIATWEQLIGEQGIGGGVKGANGERAAAESQTSVTRSRGLANEQTNYQLDRR